MIRMKLGGVRIVAQESISPPPVEARKAVISVKAVGICGSDMHVYLGRNPVIKPENHVCGHEFGGIISELPDDSENWSLGDKVCVNPVLSCGKCFYCLAGQKYLCADLRVIGGEVDGAMAEKISVPLENMVKLRPDFNMLHSAMIEPVAVAVHSSREVHNATVLIIGLGTIGLLMVQACKLNGNRVIATDIDPSHFDLARKLGAESVFLIDKESPETLSEKYIDQGVLDCVIDNVNNESTTSFAIRALRKRGRLILVGIPHGEFKVDMVGLLIKELVVSTSYLYSEDDFRTAAELVDSGKIEVESLISKRFPLSKAKDAFEFKLNSPSIKVIVEP